MAEAPVAAIVQQLLSEIIKHMGSETWKKIMFGSDLEAQLKELLPIKSIIEDALRKRDPFEVETPIQMLRTVHDELRYLFDEREARSTRQKLMGGNGLVKEVRLFFSSSNKLATSKRFARRVQSIKKALEDMATGCALVHNINAISSSAENPKWGFNQSDCSLINPVVIGRDRDRDKIISQLCDSELVSVAAIVGIGGQGKTTLARYVCIDEKVKARFGTQFWVPGSPYSSFGETINKITQYGTENAEPSNCRMPQLHPKLVERSCLLVLDNIWYQYNLSSEWLTLKNYLAAGSKVLVTTRSETVARIMGVRSPCTLRDLDESDALRLLQECVHQQGQILEGVEAIQKEIVRLIPKVPLVIHNIGCQLAVRHTIHEWEAFKNQLASKPAIELNDKVLQTLKLSYDQLDEKLKRCVVYCCLFPYNWFNRDQMILYWMALKFVKTEEEGEEFVNSLVRHGFLHQYIDDEYYKYYFRIHDVMQELLSSIGKSKHQMINSSTKEITEGVSHVYLCLDTDDAEDVPLSKLKDGQSLESILVLRRSRRRAPINVRLGLRNEKLASRFPHLKVLDLSAQGLEKVPSSIEELILLRYLNLSGNPLRKLPNKITKLVNLLSLILIYCKNLQELPRDMRELVHLRHLRVKGTDLRRMPKRFGSLTELQRLDMFVVEGKKGSVGATLGELYHLKNLKGELSIHVKGESKYVASEQMGDKEGLTGLKIIFGKSALEDEMFLEGLQPNVKNLKRLEILNYGGKKLPTWMTDDRFRESFPKLVHMSLEDKEFKRLFLNGEYVRMRIENNEYWLEWVPEHSRLIQQLKTGPIEFRVKLKVNTEGGNGLPTLRNFALGSATLIIEKQLEPRSGGGSGQDILLKACFPNLHTLELKDIPELEVLPEEFRDLSFLKILRIWNCPKLKELPRWIGSLTSLKRLSIYGATQLKTLPESIGSLTSLEDLSIDGATQLKTLPESIGSLTSLKDLSIREATQLKTLPESIGSLTSLERLSIDGATQLKTLPDSIGSLTSLEDLSIDGATQLKTLPESIGSLTSLERLSIDGATQLKTLPDSIGSLTSLEDLSIDGATQLKTLPDSIGSLTSLEYLSIDGATQLKTLPNSIGSLSSGCLFSMYKCSTTLFEKCREPTSGYWSLIQHLDLYFTTPQGDQFSHTN